MRKLLLSLFTVVIAVSFAKAENVTFDLSVGYENAELLDKVESGSVTLAFSKGEGSTAPAWYTTGAAARMYSKNVLTVSTSSTTEVIQSVTFTFSSKSNTFLTGNKVGPTVSTGAYSEDGATTGSWVGTAQAFTLTAGGTSGHARISKIEVVLAPVDGVLAPSFSLAEGIYYVAQEVTLSCATADATIHYTTDNSDPTVSSATYSDPIKVETTTTIKAIAVKGSEKSDIVSATYTIAEPATVENIAVFKETSKETVVKFANSVDVIYQNGAYLFIQDATGASLIYGTVGQKYENGNTIPAGFMGTVAEYNDLAQLLPMAETFEPAVPGTVIEPIMIKVQDITEELMNKLVKISDVAIVRDGTTRNYTITDVSGSVNAYSRFTDVSIPEDDKKYDITAIVNKYGGKPQLFPIKIVESEGGVGFADVESASSIVAAGDKAINIDAAENAQVLVVNAVGQVVANKAITAGANTIDVPAGFYVVRVNNTVTKVIIK